jgi:murein DD-endopeptidase MepM/ murein hydrolase activator NlpD
MQRGEAGSCWIGCLALSVALGAGARGPGPSAVEGLALPQPASELTVSVHARAIQPGSVVRLDVSCTCKPAGRPATARVFDREIRLVPIRDGAAWSGLIGIDLETAPGTYRVQVAAESADARPLTATHPLAVAARQFPTRRLRVAPAYVEPPAADIKRIAADAARLNALYKTTTGQSLPGRFEAPVAAAPQNTFGARSIFNGQSRSPHSGVDFPSPLGTPIASPATATVVLADDLFFTGRTVALDHGLGLISVLAHMSKIAVHVGDAVKPGDVLGEVGATGRATGPHLHWSVRLNGARVDPMSLIELPGAER